MTAIEHSSHSGQLTLATPQWVDLYERNRESCMKKNDPTAQAYPRSYSDRVKDTEMDSTSRATTKAFVRRTIAVQRRHHAEKWRRATRGRTKLDYRTSAARCRYLGLYLYYHLSIRSWVCVTTGRPSVCPFVCPIDRQQQRRPAGLLLNAMRAGDVDRQRRARCGCRAAGAGAQQHMQTA